MPDLAQHIRTGQLRPSHRVKFHRTNITIKFRVHSVTELACVVQEAGLCR